MAPKVNAEAKAGRSNGYDPEVLKGFTDRIKHNLRELDSLRGQYMRDCKEYRDDNNDIFDEAKDKGIPRKAFKAVIQTHELERKAAAVREKLESEDADNFDMIRHALGDFADTDLGKAATGENRAAA